MDIYDRSLPAIAVGDDPTLARLLTQLRLLVEVLVLGPDTPEAVAMVAGLRETVDQAAGLLVAAKPEVLASVSAGLVHAEIGEHSQARTELLAASRGLRVLMRQKLPSSAGSAYPLG